MHSAAGGVGLNVVRAARHAGAKVVATVGSRAKVAVLRAHGVKAGLIILRGEEDVAVSLEEVLRERVRTSSAGDDRFEEEEGYGPIEVVIDPCMSDLDTK